MSKQHMKNKRIKHNLWGTRFYKIWYHIKQRTENKNAPNYFRYGGRGIKNLWKTLEEFRDDTYKSYLKHIKQFGEKQTQIDRIDNDGNYCKENCQWATIKEQANNRRLRNKPENILICKTCNNKFRVRKSRLLFAKYCSYYCFSCRNKN